MNFTFRPDIKAPQGIEECDLADIENIDSESLEYQIRKFTLAKMNQDLEQRKGLVPWMQILTSLFIIFICLFMIGLGLGRFQVESAVVCTFLGTTAVEIIGLAAIILTDLFQGKK